MNDNIDDNSGRNFSMANKYSWCHFRDCANLRTISPVCECAKNNLMVDLWSTCITIYMWAISNCGGPFSIQKFEFWKDNYRPMKCDFSLLKTVMFDDLKLHRTGIHVYYHSWYRGLRFKTAYLVFSIELV